MLLANLRKHFLIDSYFSNYLFIIISQCILQIADLNYCSLALWDIFMKSTMHHKKRNMTVDEVCIHKIITAASVAMNKLCSSFILGKNESANSHFTIIKEYK